MDASVCSIKLCDVLQIHNAAAMAFVKIGAEPGKHIIQISARLKEAGGMVDNKFVVIGGVYIVNIVPVDKVVLGMIGKTYFICFIR